MGSKNTQLHLELELTPESGPRRTAVPATNLKPGRRSDVATADQTSLPGLAPDEASTPAHHERPTAVAPVKAMPAVVSATRGKHSAATATVEPRFKESRPGSHGTADAGKDKLPRLLPRRT